MVPGILLLFFSSWLRLRIQRYFPVRSLAGLPELAPQRYPQDLVTDGPFTVVRHPRYLQFLIALLGWALIANYLALYGVLALWVPGVWLIAALEERELQDRFGDEYDAYCARVPRFLPRASKRETSGSARRAQGSALTGDLADDVHEGIGRHGD